MTPADQRGGPERRADRAADAAAFFDGARLTLARHLAGLRKSDLAALVGMTPTAVAAWESGAKRPTPATVARLALSLRVEPGFFAMRASDVAALSGPPHFRSLRSTTQLARDQAFGYGQLAVDIAASLEKHVEYPEPDLPFLPAAQDCAVVPGSVTADGDDRPERAARRVRETWGMAAGPAPHLVRLLENHGVLVVFSPPQTASVDAYSFDSRLRPVVVLNPVKHDYYRQRFDVAHELGHLVMHADAEPGGRVIEDQANRFAAEFLMPCADIREHLPTTMNRGAWQVLGRLKEHWGTSIQALLYRARRLGTLSEVSYRNAMNTLTTRGWRRGEPGLITVLEQPSMLPRALELLAAEGVTRESLLDQCRVPAGIFRTVTSRTPSPPVPPAGDRSPVVSLFALSRTWSADSCRAAAARSPPLPARRRCALSGAGPRQRGQNRRTMRYVADFDPSTPSIARVYDYINGGKDNFAADRELAQRLIDVFPPITVTVTENKRFLDLAVNWVAGQGIGQFIDIGCGLPTSPGTHESARLSMPDARVAYADIDPIVLSHLRGLPAREQAGLTIVDGDVRDVAGVLAAASAGLDLSEPACLIMAALLHFFPAETARDLVARYAARLASGSYVILTMGLAAGPAADRVFELYNRDGSAPLYKHSAQEFASFFGDLPLVAPGVGDARTWRPGWPKVPAPPERESVMIVGVARVP